MTIKDLKPGNYFYYNNKLYLKTKDIILVPVASTEQHGPHLPLKTDTVTAEEVGLEICVLNAVAIQMEKRQLIAQVLPFTYQPVRVIHLALHPILFLK